MARGGVRVEILLVIVLGVLAAFHRPLAELRPAAPGERSPGTRTRVTNGADAGPGSLREAIFAAAVGGPGRIELGASRIALTTPLPPLLATGELTLAAPNGTEIDASALVAGVAIEIATPGARVSGVAVRGARGAGWLVSAPGVELTEVAASGCEVGVEAGPGAGGLRIAASTFEDNAIGVRLPPRPGGATIAGNGFSGHRQAALWAVAPEPAEAAGDELEVRGNRFADDAISLLVANVAATVEDNDVLAAREAAIYLIGRAGTVRGNRVDGARALGIFADGPDGAAILANELEDSRAVAVLVRGGHDALVESNALRRNGYGIAAVDLGNGNGDGNVRNGDGGVVVSRNRLFDQRFDGLYVLAGTPRIESNRVARSGAAGLRILDYLSLAGERTEARPTLVGNELENNAAGEVRGVYRERRPAGAER